LGPVQQAIFARRSVRRFTDQRVDRAVVERVLDAATQAPNHRLTRPWRFFVLDGPGEMRDRLAQLAEDVAWRGMPEPRDESARTRARAKGQEIAGVPLLIVAYSVPGRDAGSHPGRTPACRRALVRLQAGLTLRITRRWGPLWGVTVSHERYAFGLATTTAVGGTTNATWRLVSLDPLDGGGSCIEE
jgi:nitroreductase